MVAAGTPHGSARIRLMLALSNTVAHDMPGFLSVAANCSEEAGKVILLGTRCRYSKAVRSGVVDSDQDARLWRKLAMTRGMFAS